jgi:hypothetical protein
MVEKSGQQPSEQLIERIAGQVSRWKLTVPAILFLETAKPFSFIASQGLLLGEPLLSFLFKEARVSDYAGLLSERPNVERLIARLERDRANHGDEEGG